MGFNYKDPWVRYTKRNQAVALEAWGFRTSRAALTLH